MKLFHFKFQLQIEAIHNRLKYYNWAREHLKWNIQCAFLLEEWLCLHFARWTSFFFLDTYLLQSTLLFKYLKLLFRCWSDILKINKNQINLLLIILLLCKEILEVKDHFRKGFNQSINFSSKAKEHLISQQYHP